MSKYRAKKTRCAAGHMHDSMKEAAKCDDLCAQEERGEITHLVQQPAFTVEIDGVAVCTYKADFGYRMADSGLPIVLDVKGMMTPLFRLKKKLVEATHPGVVITIWPPKIRKARKKKAA